MDRSLLSNLKKVILVALPVIMVSLIFTFITAYFENGVNPNQWDFANSLWWWLVTISTVGYGDIYPETVLGRLSASVVIFSSFLFLGLIISELNYLLKARSQREELGLRSINFTGHVLILDENPLVMSVIDIVQEIAGDQIGIVLVTDKVDTNPYDRIYFVKGDPKSAKTLMKANAPAAKLAIVLADDRVNNPDAYTLVVATEIEKINKKIVTFAEVVDSRLRDIFKESGIDFFVTEKRLLKSIADEKDIRDLLSKALK